MERKPLMTKKKWMQIGALALAILMFAGAIATTLYIILS